MTVRIDEAWGERQAFAIDDPLTSKGCESADLGDPVSSDAYSDVPGRRACAIYDGGIDDEGGCWLLSRRRLDQSRKEKERGANSQRPTPNSQTPITNVQLEFERHAPGFYVVQHVHRTAPCTMHPARAPFEIYAPACHLPIAATGWINWMMFSVRLSRIQ
jgi:hypothetical protein